MARLILDTSLLVDIEREGAAASIEAIGDEDDVAVAAITAAELMVGIERAAGAQRRGRMEFVEAVLEVISIEDYDLDVAAAHASLLAHTHRAGQPRGAHDLIIAATARATGREVVSADQRGFADLPGVSFRSE